MNVLVRFPEPLVKSELGNLTRLCTLKCAGFIFDKGKGAYYHTLPITSVHNSQYRWQRKPPHSDCKNIAQCRDDYHTTAHVAEKTSPLLWTNMLQKLLHSTQRVTLVVFAGLEFHNVTMYQCTCGRVSLPPTCGGQSGIR